jgi:adenosylhomocysteine nucleosidase
MRLHRTITPDRPLLVVALEEEAAHIHASDLPVLVTGVGKVNAAVAVSTILGEHSPSRVVNLGTAGALHDGLAGTYIVRSVIQHDLDDAVLFDLTGLHVSETIDVADEGLRLATGDAFITDARIREQLARTADLVDMEGYAVARAAIVAGVPVTIVKEVSDAADGSARRSWRDSVDICAERLGAWVRGNLLG